MDEILADVSLMQSSASSGMPHRLRVRNRRKRYLEQHPQYFEASLETAEPLLYDRLIRRFQSPAERAAERRQRGYAGNLEADLLRSEAKISEAQTHDTGTSYRRTHEGGIIAEHAGDEGLSKDEARDRWIRAMTLRFVEGRDTDFYYELVDENEQYDDKRTEDQDRADEWFDDESPDTTLRPGGPGGKTEGETGIQDF